MLREGIRPPADGEERRLDQRVPPNHPPSGISSPGGAQADPARAVLACTAPVACLESGHTPAARRAALSPRTRAAHPRTWQAPGTSNPGRARKPLGTLAFLYVLISHSCLFFLPEQPAGYFYSLR